ncbi:MAG: hypothetical protein ABI432_08695 [Flavobacteriales bacterium]
MASKAAYHTELLLRTLRMSEQDYAHLILEEGMHYLDLYMSDDTAGRTVLMELPDYWTWWRRAFEQRNAQFIAEQHLETWAVGKWERGLLTKLFYELHSAELLEIKPARKVMRNAIAVLRQQMTNR